MKKIYILATMVAFAFSANAQIIDEDLEFYTLGDMGTQNTAVFSNWSGAPGTDLGFTVTDAQANSGSQALLINNSPAQDPLLLLGNVTSGDYTLQFQTYIPAGKTGYFNIQGATEDPGTGFQGAGTGGAGTFNSSDIYYNEGGAAPGTFDDNGETATYPEDTWFITSIYFDLDAATPTYEITVDGTLVNAAPVEFAADATLGAINFYAVSANEEMYVDDILFQEGLILGTSDFSASNFSVYPNPVQDRLNIQSTNTVDSVVVYDVLGKVVLSATPGVVSPSVDMSTLTSGAYLVNITINGSSKTVKVIK